MSALTWIGCVAILFGLISFYATNHLGAFGIANLALGGVALLLALGLAVRRIGRGAGPYARSAIARGVAGVAVALALGVACERAAHGSGIRWDWTFERRYELAPQLADLLRELPGLKITLFYDPLDPRIRRTRLLAQELVRASGGQYAEYDIEKVPEEIDVYAVDSSNTLVLELGNDFQVVERPLEGALFEALYRLRAVEAGVIGILRGEGEGDPERETELGFGGLAAALATEGYELRSFVTLSMRDVPEEIDAILAIGPQRPIGERAQAALRRFLARGGALIALLEPGVESGLEDLLAEWGMTTPDELVIDPASGEGLESEPEGVCPLVYNYETHNATRGLDRNRMTFFCGARPFDLSKPQVDDELTALALSSPKAWRSDDPKRLKQTSAEPEGVARGYQPIAVSGRYLRDGVETRIFAVGDSDFASNRYLRSLYNLDLVMNGVHWALAREPQIVLRPKVRDTVQFPLPVQDSLQMLYGVGLLLPELLLIAGGVLWLRQRSA
ncbi:MAG TPA: GldG family protein [Myxococcota bacterium]|nr:GldG family protein [Myxococcota bacterium]